jgi:hypothetical protein
MSGQFQASADLAVQDRLRMTANRRLAEPQDRSGHFIDERNSRPSRELTAHTLVTKSTELVRWWSLSRNRCITNSGLSSSLDFTAIQTSLLAAPKEFPTNGLFFYFYSGTTLKVTLWPECLPVTIWGLTSETSCFFTQCTFHVPDKNNMCRKMQHRWQGKRDVQRKNFFRAVLLCPPLFSQVVI